MFQLHEGIIVPKFNLKTETGELLTTEQVNFNKQMPQRVYQYTKAQATIRNDQEVVEKNNIRQYRNPNATGKSTTIIREHINNTPLSMVTNGIRYQ